jgi:hypothetical protein
LDRKIRAGVELNTLDLLEEPLDIPPLVMEHR